MESLDPQLKYQKSFFLLKSCYSTKKSSLGSGSACISFPGSGSASNGCGSETLEASVYLVFEGVLRGIFQSTSDSTRIDPLLW